MQGIIRIVASRMIPLVVEGNGNSDKSNITVDQFIAQNQQEQLERTVSQSELDGYLGAAASEEEKERIKQEILGQAKSQLEIQNSMLFEEGRKKFSEMSGTEIDGSEKLSDVFSEIINSKINDYFQPEASGNGLSKFLPIFVSLFLFLTIVSIGYFAAFFLIYLMSLIFYLLKKSGAIKITKVQTEAETME